MASPSCGVTPVDSAPILSGDRVRLKKSASLMLVNKHAAMHPAMRMNLMKKLAPSPGNVVTAMPLRTSMCRLLDAPYGV